MSNVNLYASREGALYQSYDNFAGVQGFYDPSQEAPAQPSSTGNAAMMASSLALSRSSHWSCISAHTPGDPGLATFAQGLWRNHQRLAIPMKALTHVQKCILLYHACLH